MKENLGQIQEALKKYESKFSNIENKMEELLSYQKKLDSIKRNLEHDRIQKQKTKALRKRNTKLLPVMKCKIPHMKNGVILKPPIGNQK
jgi:uncharacterized phage infection (PIP) family protein YhgE